MMQNFIRSQKLFPSLITRSYAIIDKNLANYYLDIKLESINKWFRVFKLTMNIFS